MQKQNTRFTIVLLLIVVVMGVNSGFSGRRKDYFVYKDALDEVAAVVNGQELTLEDLAFYIVYKEKQVEGEAFIYDPEDTGKYWRIHTNGTYTRTEAKEAAIMLAVHDEIFYQLSQQESIQLNEEEEAYAANVQADFWSDLDENALEKLGVSREVLDESMQKIAYAQKYQYLLAEMNGAELEEYGVSGEKYQELLEEHDYEIVEEVWQRVHFGSITVDH